MINFLSLRGSFSRRGNPALYSFSGLLRCARNDKITMFLLLFFIFFFPAQAAKNTIDLSGFQRADGSISTYYKGDTVDAYFASKSLLMAADAGFNIEKPARKWIGWALKNQDEDGRIFRYEYDKNAEGWYYSENADADDALLALWIELLYRTEAKDGMPAKWQKSIKLASARLEELFNKEQGIYHISKDMPVGLLMDNMEIYAAFKAISTNAKKNGNDEISAHYASKAKSLAQNIVKNFMSENGTYKISTQARSEDDFYPDKVAQLYPVFYELPNPLNGKTDAPIQYKNWIKNNGEEWLNSKQDYPWGLIAVIGLKLKNKETASCWQNRAEPFRYSARWNVMEETALQVVKYNVVQEQKTNIPCVNLSEEQSL